MKGESLEISSVFTVISEKDVFDLEKFKSENPDLYNKYTDSHIDTTVDTKKLEKTLPDVYRKYITITPSTRPITLRVAKNKK